MKNNYDVIIVGAAPIMVVTAPTVDILREAGIRAGENSFIVINDNMETNIEEAYAAGDYVGKSHKIIVAVRQYVPVG
jgi:thioredoxin reductase